jgi:hypothetical protein
MCEVQIEAAQVRIEAALTAALTALSPAGNEAVSAHSCPSLLAVAESNT